MVLQQIFLIIIGIARNHDLSPHYWRSEKIDVTLKRSCTFSLIEPVEGKNNIISLTHLLNYSIDANISKLYRIVKKEE